MVMIWIFRLLLLGGGVTTVCACLAHRPMPVAAPGLDRARYVQSAYRTPGFKPSAIEYLLEPLPVALTQGIEPEEAAQVFYEELVQAMQANGLRVNQGNAEAILSGQVERFTVASPVWRFLSGRGQAQLQVRGEIRRGQEVLFAFQDAVKVNPPVNPRYRPALEPNLLARQAARRLATNVLNELLLPLRHQEEEAQLPQTKKPLAPSTE